MEEYTWYLQQTPLFKGIKHEEMRKLLDCLSASVKKYSKNEVIFQAGDEVRSIGIIMEGKIQIQNEDFFGARTIIAELGRGMMFAEAFVCANIDRFPVTVLAADNSVVFLLNYKKMMTVCSKACGFHNLLTENLVKLLARKNVFQNERLEVLSKRSTREKILAYLSVTAKHKGNNKFTLPFNRQEMADYLCVDRSAMSSELGRMKDDGLIDFNKNEFIILSKNIL